MTAIKKLKTEPRIPATERLASFVVGARVDEETLQRAVPVVLDTLAVMMAGGVEPAAQAVQASLEPASGPGAVKSFWSNTSYSASDAALLNGTASHVLDYDDVSMLATCHPSVPVFSALLSVRPWNEVSGRELLEAFAIGTEVLIRVGQAMGFRHYALGFHATATLGTIGAAAACARVMRLDGRRTRHAIAIAASLSSGLQVNFGSMVKSLHVGNAAVNGLKAARLAAAGIEGAAEVLDGDGFLRAFSGGEASEWPDDLVLGEPFVLADPGFEQKRYPCCYMLHKMIEATLVLRRETNRTLSDVTAAHVLTWPGGTKALIHPYPKSGLNALFSGPYAVAAALADGKIDLSSFTDEAVLRPEIQQRLKDVTVVEADPSSVKYENVSTAPVTVTLTLADGGTLARTITIPPGSLRDPLTPPQLRDKWIDCLRRARPDADATTLGGLFDDGLAISGVGTIGGWLDKVAATLTGGNSAHRN